jgi:hypothetical protein
MRLIVRITEVRVQHRLNTQKGMAGKGFYYEYMNCTRNYP